MQINLLDSMLESYQSSETPVIVTLQNRIRVTGKVKAFDNYVMVIEGQKREIVYRHAISSVTSFSVAEQKRREPFQRQPMHNGKKSSSSKKPSALQMPSLPEDAKNLNTALQDGLAKWMREQKAAK